MAYKYTISRTYLLDTAKRLSSQGVKVHKGLRNLDVRELKNQFSNLVSLAKEDWREQTGEDRLPNEQYDLLRKSFSEEVVKAENVKPNSLDDWVNILVKAAESYDTSSSNIKNEQNVQKSVVNIENSNIYFDIINSIASKASNANAKRFKAIKYTYVEEGTGDLIRPEFGELLSDDDIFALSRLSETYKDNKGFTADPLYWEIKDRAVAAGLNKLKSMNIGSVNQEPISASFNFDF